MSTWGIINSPLALAIMSLLCGGIMASWITALWQKRANRYNAKLECSKSILSIYHEYIRLVRGDPERLQGQEFDSVHARLFTQIKIARLIFRDKGVAKGWDSVIGALANMRKLCLQKEDDLAREKLDDIFEMATIATEKMFRELL